MNNNYRHIQQHNQSPHHHHHHHPNPPYYIQPGTPTPVVGSAAYHSPLPLAHHPQYSIPRSVNSAPVSPAPYVIYRNNAPPPPAQPFSPLASPAAAQAFPSSRQSVYSQSYFDEKRASVAAAAATGMVQQYSQPSTPPAATVRAPDRYHRRKSLSTSLSAPMNLTEPITTTATTTEEPSSSSSTNSNSNSSSASNLSSASSVTSSASPSPALTHTSASTGNTSTTTNASKSPAKPPTAKLPPIQTYFNPPGSSTITASQKQHRQSKSTASIPHSYSTSNVSLPKQPTNQQQRKSLVIDSSSNTKREKVTRDKEFLEITNDRKLHAKQVQKQQQPQPQPQQRQPPSTLVLPSDRRRNSTIGLTSSSSRSVSTPVLAPYGSSTSLSSYGHSYSRSKDLPSSYGSSYQTPSSSKESHRRAASSATITQQKLPSSNPARPHSPMSMKSQPLPASHALPEIKRPSSSMSSRKLQPVEESHPAVDRQAEFYSRPTTPSVTKPSSMADLRQPARQQSKSKFSKLKKAFSFGSKKESLQHKPSFTSDDRSSIFSIPSYRRKNSITSTKSAILPRTATDNSSIASNKSTASNISFANLKRMSRGLFKHKHDESVDSAISLSQQQPAPTFNTTNLPFVGHHSKSTSIASAATATQPVLSHSVAEAEPPTTTNMESPINTLSVIAQPASPRDLSPLEVLREDDRLPSLTSTDSSAPNTEEPAEHGDGCDDDDMAVGDTVFPKKLDLLTVETIRSSLERTKSLERRRSRRSTRSARSEKSEATAKDHYEEVPNPTEVHVHEEAISDVPSKDTPAPRSILKASSIGGSNHSASSSITTISTVNNNNNNPATGNNNNSTSSTNSTAIGGALSATGVESSSTSGLIDFDLEQSELNLDFSFESMPMPKSIQSDDVANAVQKNKEYNSQPSQVAHKRLSMHSKTTSSTSRSPSPTVTPDGNSYHYHPLYRNRLSQFVPSHSNHSSSESSMLSQHAHHHHSSSSLSGTIPSPINRPGRTVQFSSRIVIYDTYDKNDYDRRAELDTCNRLTPALAQQIKEELNNFKMEMEIHADSRIYTHFF
ncbi:hypothetical protein TRVA0_097S00144 [Trichomonascus vanleenenianus]|uniref:uncharacterized protein n=1 Tax=Trichomonascus vanleenenianus TaxID=2268995 RepID=UPI003EC9AFEF